MSIWRILWILIVIICLAGGVSHFMGKSRNQNQPRLAPQISRETIEAQAKQQAEMAKRLEEYKKRIIASLPSIADALNRGDYMAALTEWSAFDAVKNQMITEAKTPEIKEARSKVGAALPVAANKILADFRNEEVSPDEVEFFLDSFRPFTTDVELNKQFDAAKAEQKLPRIKSAPSKVYVTVKDMTVAGEIDAAFKQRWPVGSPIKLAFGKTLSKTEAKGAFGSYECAVVQKMQPVSFQGEEIQYPVSIKVEVTPIKKALCPTTWDNLQPLSIKIDPPKATTYEELGKSLAEEITRKIAEQLPPFAALGAGQQITLRNAEGELDLTAATASYLNNPAAFDAQLAKELGAANSLEAQAKLREILIILDLEKYAGWVEKSLDFVSDTSNDLATQALMDRPYYGDYAIFAKYSVRDKKITLGNFQIFEDYSADEIRDKIYPRLVQYNAPGRSRILFLAGPSKSAAETWKLILAETNPSERQALIVTVASPELQKETWKILISGTLQNATPELRDEILENLKGRISAENVPQILRFIDSLQDAWLQEKMIQFMRVGMNFPETKAAVEAELPNLKNEEVKLALTATPTPQPSPKRK